MQNKMTSFGNPNTRCEESSWKDKIKTKKTVFIITNYTHISKTEAKRIEIVFF